MIKISVISYNNATPAQTLSAIFGEKGGTLGRSDDNYFVLPDPKRYVSRLQASISSDGVRHKIVNLSQANPILINGQEIDSGKEYDLTAGDEIQIGLYLLRAELYSGVIEDSGGRGLISNDDVNQVMSSTNDLNTRPAGRTSTNPFAAGLAEGKVVKMDPFADLLEPIAFPASGIPSKPVEAIETILQPFPSSAAANPSIKLVDDELLANAPSISVHPPLGNHISAEPNQNVLSGFDDLLVNQTHNGDFSQPGKTAIPDDFDPFSFPSQSVRNTSDPLENLSNNDITLESLKGGKHDLNNLMAPPLDSYERSLLDASSLKMHSSSDVDPLVLFSSDSVIMKKPDNNGSDGHVVSNHVPEMNAHFMIPQANKMVPHKNETASSDTIKEGRVSSAPTVFDSTPDPEQPCKEPHMNATHLPNGAVELSYEKSVVTEPTESPAISDEDSVPKTNANLVDSRELMQAFLRGAGIPPHTISSAASNEFMEMIGELLVTSMQGTVELIGSRALVKREVRADMTMIVAKKNNPLKFLPDGKTALMQMLREKIPGFMDPVEAIQDAYEDLCAHQLGVVAGMRSAMAEVLERFNPELLENKMKDRSFIDSVLPANRKAKMWDQYTELFHEIDLKVQDDFQMLFGKAFVTAYEMEIDRFKNRRQDD